VRSLRLTMTEPQARFFQLTDKYPLFCGGYGTGKTETLLNCALRDGLEAPAGLIALYEPTYDLIQMILAPRLEQKLTDLGIRYTYNKTRNVITVKGGRCADFVMRTLDNPARIIGYESYRAHVDEIDTLKADHALLAWRRIIARNRQKPRGIETPFNRVSAYTTPEGFRFAYDTWVRNKKPGYEMVQAATYSNPFLPDDYVDSLRGSYPPQLIKAYIEGLFVNLTSGSVYPDFDRKLNHAPTTIKAPTAVEAGEPLHVGMDFNVNHMAAIVFVLRDDAPHAVAEVTKGRDTPTVARILKERFVGHHITIYPDASGANPSSKAAAVSDISILRSAGFTIRAHTANPRVKDRVNSVNALILNDKGERRLKVNTDACPTFTESLEQQPYDKNGEPDKDPGHGYDHTNDAAGYLCHFRWPVVRSVTRFDTTFHMER
jgi:hypothetical protein